MDSADKENIMLAVAITDIQSLYEGQPLLTQVGGFPPPGSGGTMETEVSEEEDDSAAG